MIRLTCALAGCLLLSGTVSAQFPPMQKVSLLPKLSPEELKRLAPYMTKDFTLTSQLEVRDELTGFGAFFGTIWRIEADGRWSITRVYMKQSLLIGEGKISKLQIYELAKRLVAYDPMSLPNVGAAIVNPHVITISYGGRDAAMTFGVDQKLPQTNLQDLIVPAPPATGVISTKNPPPVAVLPPLPPVTRYAGLQSIVRSMIQPNLGIDFKIPDRLKVLVP